jgi:hypothetical protein
MSASPSPQSVANVQSMLYLFAGSPCTLPPSYLCGVFYTSTPRCATNVDLMRHVSLQSCILAADKLIPGSSAWIPPVSEIGNRATCGPSVLRKPCNSPPTTPSAIPNHHWKTLKTGVDTNPGNTFPLQLKCRKRNDFVLERSGFRARVH